MIIGKKKMVIPQDFVLSNDERMKRQFSDRKKLHDDSVPAFVAYIDKSVWNSFILQANDEYTNRKHEASGIILGLYYTDQHGEFSVGTDFEAGSGSETSAAFCEISIQDQVRIARLTNEKNLLQLIWIHSHPSFGAFYSAVDYKTLKGMYYAPHQCGIVVDNVKEEYLGFKVSKHSIAHEFKDIFLVNLNDEYQMPVRPYGKNPGKIFFAQNRNLSSGEGKQKEPVKLFKSPDTTNQKKDELILALIERIQNDLKLLKLASQQNEVDIKQLIIDWNKYIDKIDRLLNDLYGQKPYSEVAGLFSYLSEMRSILKNDISDIQQNKFSEIVNELGSRFTKS